MSTLTIELPEALSKQLQRKKISQQQVEMVFFRALQLYLSETPLTTTHTEMTPSHAPTTLRDLRGSVPVAGPQDFDAIRRQVISTQIRQRMPHGS